MSLPNSFKRLTVSDYPLLKPYFYPLPYPLAIYSLPSLIAWNSESNPTFYSVEGDSLLMMMGGTLRENRCLLLPLSPSREIVPYELKDIAERLNLSSFSFIPESYVKKFHSSIRCYFEVSEQPEYHDYLYRKNDLIELKGKNYLKKRNHINKFIKMYVETGKAAIEPLSAVNLSETLSFLDRWCAEDNRCDPGRNRDLAEESRAAGIMIRNMELLEAKGIVIRIDGEISAFGIATSLTDSMKILNFEKAYSHINGLYQFLDRECAVFLFDGVECINKESDMGIPGLASSKESYNPVARIRSYLLRLL